jgi:hypothetical protein
MMKVSAIVMSLALFCGTTLFAAEALKSGPAVGERVDAYYVTKAAGNPDDGVEVGKELCYRCKMGNRPVVMIFTRKTDDKLAKLLQEMDKMIATDSARDLQASKKLVSFVNLIGIQPSEGRDQSQKFLTENKIEKIAFVVPNDQPNGPDSYKLSADAETTVLVYTGGTVKASFAVPAGGLTDDVTKQVLEATKGILN